MSVVTDEVPGSSGPSVAPVDAPGGTAFLLSGLGRLVREEIEKALGEAGLSLRYLSVLGHLSRDPGLSYSELARRAGVTAQSMQATLARLEEDGLVERTTEPGRGRTAHLRLSAAGVAALRSGRAVVAAVDDRLLGTLTDADRADLDRLLLRALAAVTSGPGRRNTKITGPPRRP